MRSERERLLDILEAIERIEKYASRGKQAFERDQLIQNWMVNYNTMIGEACRALPDEFQAKYADVSWADIMPCVTSLSITILGSTWMLFGLSWNAIFRN